MPDGSCVAPLSAFKAAFAASPALAGGCQIGILPVRAYLCGEVWGGGEKRNLAGQIEIDKKIAELRSVACRVAS